MNSELGNIPDDATLTASDIARLANVGRAAVSNWRRRHTDFPQPVGGTPASPTFDAKEVEQWLRREGKLHQADPRHWAWKHIESYQPAARIGDALAIAGAYLLARSTKPASNDRILTPRQLAGALRALDHGLATLIGTVLPEQWDPALSAILRTVDQLGRHQDAETVFEYLHHRYVTSAQSMSGLAGTPDTVAQVMLAIAGHGSRILDFTCGTGSILRMAADKATQHGTTTQCFAQEIKPQYAMIALLRLWFVHRRATRAGRRAPAPQMQVGDSLLADAYPDLRADVAIANFPFGIHDWGHDQLIYDPRWVYGMPPRTEPELAWIQHALAHLRPGGTAVVLMPPAAASRPAGRRIRAELLRQGALQAVIALPAGLMPPVGVGLQIWVLTQPTNRQPAADGILFVDSAASTQPLTDLIAKAWHDYQSGKHTDAPGLHRVVPAIDLLDSQVDLTPQRHLQPPTETTIDPAATLNDIDVFKRLLTTLQTSLPAVRPATRDPRGTVARANLADLIRSGSIEAIRTPTRGQTYSGNNTPRSGSKDLRIRADDILLPTTGREIDAHVAHPEEVGTELDAGVQLLRVNRSQFDPWFVAGTLSLAHNRSQRATSSSGVLRIDLKHLTIPVLPVADQQRYGQAFRQLAEYRTTLQQLTNTGTVLIHDITHGLNAGVLDVRPLTDARRSRSANGLMSNHLASPGARDRRP
ncbi:type II restriction endonuclease subunit M [Virgisporangium aliadipatigenens]|uniref:Type II restriction endonuclease subunit M n=1 Tax=Virgisporangium aliadipatigenens TaxID=741659 RepID=A0A8J3YYV6_9ACTN|nr:N-6 DNA methylase [Virgisporangium aliadipatigenens]GIJ52205.1 type II restriction endonuclease subunit M [Virgisporangium aliadipatigenens]